MVPLRSTVMRGPAAMASVIAIVLGGSQAFVFGGASGDLTPLSYVAAVLCGNVTA